MPDIDALLPQILGSSVRADPLWALVAFLGSTLALPALLTAVAWDLRRDSRHLVTLLATLGLALGSAVILQQLGGRPRPEAVLEWWPAPPTPSMPSGHAAVAAALALTWTLIRPGWGRISVALPLAFHIGISRVALGHHHPTDVALGFLLGAGAGWSAWGMLASGARGPRRWGWVLPFQVALVMVISGMAYVGALPHAMLSWQGADKVCHALLFGLVAFWAALWTGGSYRAILIPLAIAMIEELAQAGSARRTCDPLDAACDLCGMVVAYGIARWLMRGVHARVPG